MGSATARDALCLHPACMRGMISHDLQGERGDLGMRGRICELRGLLLSLSRTKNGGLGVTHISVVVPSGASLGVLSRAFSSTTPEAPAGTAAPHSLPGQQKPYLSVTEASKYFHTQAST
jgi:hypothetical protein